MLFRQVIYYYDKWTCCEIHAMAQMTDLYCISWTMLARSVSTTMLANICNDVVYPMTIFL